MEKLTVIQLVKIFSAFYGTQRFIFVFTTARHWSLSRARCIRSTPSHLFCLSYFIIIKQEFFKLITKMSKNLNMNFIGWKLMNCQASLHETFMRTNNFRRHISPSLTAFYGSLYVICRFHMSSLYHSVFGKVVSVL